jgi:hypothetical protein
MKNLKFLFIGNIPLLYPEKSIAKQVKVELWLGLELSLDTKLTKLENLAKIEVNKKLEYVV